MCGEPLSFWLCTAGKHIDLKISSTACWRGYVGSWKVIDERLYLTKVSGCSADGSRLNIQNLFPGFSKRVFAHWFTGEVRCPYGKILHYIHMGYASTYEQDLFLTFSKGILISKRIVSNGVGKEGDSEGYGLAAFTTLPVDNKYNR